VAVGYEVKDKERNKVEKLRRKRSQAGGKVDRKEDG
jgi:hypothetical protein